MVSSTQQTFAATNQLGSVSRPARALIGWMTQSEGQLQLAQRQINLASSPEHIARASQARAAVASRREGLDQADVISDLPAELAGYIETFCAQPAYVPFAADGWSVRVANLSKVCALQPVVFWDHAVERAEHAIAGDIKSLATISLPIPGPTQLPIQFDQSRNTWIIPSRNPNLRIIGHFVGPIEGKTACGFFIEVTPSFVQVVSHRGRILLRDGYHRSLGLLARGLTHVPVLYREFGEFENLGLGPGMLSEQSYLGSRPPLLADYLRDDVSAEIYLPASQKMIVVQGMEMNPLG